MIKEIIKACGISQVVIARELSITRQALSCRIKACENGLKRIKTILDIIDYEIKIVKKKRE